MLEQILQDFSQAYALRSVSLRYFNAAGADPDGETGELHQPETRLIPVVLDAAQGSRDSISIYGNDYDTPDGTCIRDYIHVTDLAEAHLKALNYLEQGGQTDAFNLANGTGFSVQEVVNVARHVTGCDTDVKYRGRRAGDPPALVVDSQRTRLLLGWEPRFAELERIIETAWNWHQIRPT